MRALRRVSCGGELYGAYAAGMLGAIVGFLSWYVAYQLSNRGM